MKQKLKTTNSELNEKDVENYKLEDENENLKRKLRRMEGIVKVSHAVHFLQQNARFVERKCIIKQINFWHK